MHSLTQGNGDKQQSLYYADDGRPAPTPTSSQSTVTYNNETASRTGQNPQDLGSFHPAQSENNSHLMVFGPLNTSQPIDLNSQYVHPQEYHKHMSMAVQQIPPNSVGPSNVYTEVADGEGYRLDYTGQQEQQNHYVPYSQQPQSRSYSHPQHLANNNNNNNNNNIINRRTQSHNAGYFSRSSMNPSFVQPGSIAPYQTAPPNAYLFPQTSYHPHQPHPLQQDIEPLSGSSYNPVDRSVLTVSESLSDTVAANNNNFASIYPYALASRVQESQPQSQSSLASYSQNYLNSPYAYMSHPAAPPPTTSDDPMHGNRTKNGLNLGEEVNFGFPVMTPTLQTQPIVGLTSGQHHQSPELVSQMYGQLNLQHQHENLLPGTSPTTSTTATIKGSTGSTATATTSKENKTKLRRKKSSKRDPTKSTDSSHSADSNSNSSTSTGSASSSSSQFPCPHCSKVFAKPFNLKSHLVSHSTLKPFKCVHCSRSFARDYDRKRHEDIHGSYKTYRCGGNLVSPLLIWGCSKRFSRLDALVKHYRSDVGLLCLKPFLDRLRPYYVWKGASNTAVEDDTDDDVDEGDSLGNIQGLDSTNEDQDLWLAYEDLVGCLGEERICDLFQRLKVFLETHPAEEEASETRNS
ncbi:hypothetical protein WICPIJ_007394 [Wickerhamomyces pijperi]|uniref:C2H2-type domain-containing protein n=1 Tax=Wickerhamomyces pijperi TaxID=599730 RepID=A0A9P8Q0D3_WICPI|nr:hypothetical protein WICPIJ_007394 [Wickerhamomyces pijperi]